MSTYTPTNKFLPPEMVIFWRDKALMVLRALGRVKSADEYKVRAKDLVEAHIAVRRDMFATHPDLDPSRLYGLNPQTGGNPRYWGVSRDITRYRGTP